MKKHLSIILFFAISLFSFSQTCNHIGTYTLNHPSVYGPTNPLLKGDFNNDSKMDVIMRIGGNALTFLQLNTNSFSVITNTVVNDYFYVADDFNNDSKLDLITPNYIYMGQGNGTFTQAISGQTLTPISMLGGAVSGDFNNDNNKDFITCDGVIKAYLGQGNGTFNSPSTYSLISGNYGDITTADFNSDGNLDFAVTSNSQITIFRGNGSGSFTPTLSLSSYSATTPVRIKASDINNDGKKDLIILYSGVFSTIAVTGTVSTILNNGNFSFSSLQTFTCPAANKVDVGDFNNDGFADISGPKFYGNTDMIFYNNGSGFFNTANYFNYPGNAFSVYQCVAGDFNNDNITDLAVATTSAGSITFLYSYNGDCVWPGDANGNWTVNSNDFLEIGLQFNQTGSARTTTGNIWSGITYTEWTGLTSNGKNKANSDCNGDGKVDLLDTLAIYNNYNLFHTKNDQFEMSPVDISIVPDQSSVLKNTWGTASIFLGDVSNNISSVHGVAFNVNYDNSLIETDSVWIEYIPSFINSNNIYFRKRVFANSILYTATSHTNQIDASGNGKIAVLHYKIKPTLSANTVLNLSLSAGSKLSASSVTSTLSTGSATLNAVISDVGIKENTLKSNIIIYPNPSSGQITIRQLDRNQILDNIDIYNSLGQLIFSKKLNSTTQTIETNLSKGVYYYTIHNSTGQTFKNKLIIN
jgi:hypothetical protein